MKAIGMILLTIFLGKSCSNEAQNDINNAVLQYSAHTRGFHLKIIVNNQTATVSKGRTPDSMTQTQTKISDSDWKELIALFEKTNLETFPDLKDPTQKRHYDGAAIADLKVRYQDKNFETVDFDHGFPPAEIEGLVNKIVALTDEKE
ncbi:hypothetical protein [Flavobacterium macrobrachii]|uniref:Lipoprotein n=1 Tax=Flavobacterium macrobrachii TaxID=591204 RepID=A0ABS2D0P3_9FLAO|nr:hypothetical protein [Flavobacterium macrobrachii]MBM6500773.1 hypothetical protein [Flavobacterium macrobrachii]